MNAQSIVSGILSGTVYAMLAVGLVVVYRTSRVLNLAHGESFAAAGVATAILVQMGVLPWLSVIISTTLPTYKRVRSGLALVPEGRQILGALTVEDNLRLVRAAWSRSGRGDFQAQLNGVYELFPRLKERASQLGGSLSGGEQQMLAIGRAVLVRPSLLILDEPTQGLAPVVVKELGRVLATLKTRFSMIVVEQKKEFLDGFVDTKYEMHAGVLHAASR